MISIVGFSFAILIALTMPSHASEERKFFPEGTWDETLGWWKPERRKAHYERWFGNQLAAMNEEPLWLDTGSSVMDTTVRLLFLPTFSPGSMVKVTNTEDGKVRYQFKQLDGAGGYEPGQLRITTDGMVNKEHAAEIAALVGSIDSWGSDRPSEELDIICLDGTQIVLEYLSEGRHSVATRHECEMPPGDVFRRLTLLLNDLTGGQVVFPGTFDSNE